MPRSFDVKMTRVLSADNLDWPEVGAAGTAGEDSGFGCNRSYMDLRGLPWFEARRVYRREGELIDRIVGSGNPEEEYSVVEDELYDDPEGLFGLDLGVASSVCALSAIRCIPFTSCNGGAFGGCHHELYPLVAFYARPAHVDLLLECAEQAGCGLEAAGNGSVVLYAPRIEHMRGFAFEASRRSPVFGKLRLSAARGRPSDNPGSGDKQLKLF